MTSCEFAHDDGAYVLGALAPAERAAYERHLGGCADCREAVAEIAVLPGLLGRLDPAGLDSIAMGLDAVAPSVESRLPTLLANAREVRRRDRRRARYRTLGGVLAAACLALIVGLGATVLTRGNPPPVPGGSPATSEPVVQFAAMRPVRGAAPVTAEIALDDTRWGTKVTMHCSYPPNGEYPKAYTFRLVAYGADGAQEQVGSWLAAPGDDLTFSGVTRFSGAELTRLELLRPDGTALLGYDVR
ncbi:anti-sigma factor family protein [Plantactinospora sp. GCM10030261]|uniref:anti-sigma factor n=1 Tax=Plantactinospora sp. GCM10030261 TaxID=3273420 RepID=UPI00360DEFA9